MARTEAAHAAPATATTGWGGGIADPAPLGLAAFAATTFFLSAVNTNMLPKTVESGVLGLAFFYGGLAQLLAGMWEFTKGNTFGALAFGTFGAFWLSFWYLVTSSVPAMVAAKASAGDINHAVGTFLLVFTVFTTYMAVAALRVSVAVLAVFVFLALTFLFLTIGAFAASETWTKTGGWFGLITAVLAWYASFAGVTNATFKRVVLPVLPR